ncbi:MAG: glycosyltransferase family 4 protein [Myxacorys californica WJT36-NPBG1]|jgi:glycosyltransferase involved in cell wall biosynthesis|nr:glycosyltransferase family 4 protein [Myxacorys californica WJT36-NPBG1]
MMKICIVTHKVIHTDGQGRVNYELVRYLLQQGHCVTLIATDVDLELAAKPNLVWNRVPIPAWVPSALLQNQVFALKARYILNQHANEFDIVHLNGCITYYSADVNSSHFVHSNWLKCAYHPAQLSNGLSSAYQWLYTAINAVWEQRSYARSQVVIAVSDFVKQSLVEDAKISAAKISVIPNGVDPNEFRPLQTGEENRLRRELNLSDAAFLIFFAGDIKLNRKNLDLVLRSLPHLDPNLHLVVAGVTEGSPYPAMAQALQLCDRVHFLGYRTDIPVLLRGADAFAFPSHYDPFSLAVVEALASGIPVITAPSVGASTLICSGENGFVLKSSNDLDGMIAILNRLERDRAVAKSIGSAGRVTATRLSWEAMASCYEAVYKELINQRGEVFADSVGTSRSRTI